MPLTPVERVSVLVPVPAICAMGEREAAVPSAVTCECVSLRLNQANDLTERAQSVRLGLISSVIGHCDSSNVKGKSKNHASAHLVVPCK